MAEFTDNKPIYIVWNEYELGDCIGQGSFGQVFKCTERKTGKQFAIKKFKNRFNSKKIAY